ncbi:MAG: class I SAM-dependent methyltransferase [Limisphaerales bacterium]
MQTETDQDLLSDLSDVANTALVTLFSRARESKSEDPILEDREAERVVMKLLPGLSYSGNALHQSLFLWQLDYDMQLYVALRSRRFDGYAQDFLSRHPDGLIVNLGCGLDTRRWRLESDQVVDLDLPEMVALRRQLLGDDPIGCDVLDYAWIETVASLTRGPVMFLAEGLFMYLPIERLQDLVATLAKRFPGGELVAEMFNSHWLRPETRSYIDTRLRKELGFGKKARFISGLRESSEIEQWHPSIRLLDEWFFVDEDETKLGAIRKLRRFRRIRKRQWAARYLFEV